MGGGVGRCEAGWWWSGAGVRVRKSAIHDERETHGTGNVTCCCCGESLSITPTNHTASIQFDKGTAPRLGNPRPQNTHTQTSNLRDEHINCSRWFGTTSAPRPSRGHCWQHRPVGPMGSCLISMPWFLRTGGERLERCPNFAVNDEAHAPPGSDRLLVSRSNLVFKIVRIQHRHPAKQVMARASVAYPNLVSWFRCPV